MWIVSRPLHPGQELARLLVLQSSTCWRRAQGAFRGFLFQDCCHDTPWRSTVQHSVQRSQVITGCCPLVAPKNSLKVNPAFFLRDAGFSAISILLLRRNKNTVWAIPLVCSFENLRHPAKNMETHPKHPKHPTTYIYIYLYCRLAKVTFFEIQNENQGESLTFEKLRLLWWALPIVDLLKASTLLAFSALYAFVVAKSETWFGGHHYVCSSDKQS